MRTSCCIIRRFSQQISIATANTHAIPEGLSRVRASELRPPLALQVNNPQRTESKTHRQLRHDVARNPPLDPRRLYSGEAINSVAT